MLRFIELRPYCCCVTVTAEARQAFLKSLYSIFLRSAVPASYGAVVVSAQRAGAASGVAVWYPDGVLPSTDAYTYHGLPTLLLTSVGAVGTARFATMSSAMRQRRDRVVAALGGERVTPCRVYPNLHMHS